jgi:hypothetical protein
MRKPYTKVFMKTYETAFNQYVKGNWSEAKTGFEKVLTIIKGDKPTQNLLDFMASTNNTPPADWKGYKFFAE